MKSEQALRKQMKIFTLITIICIVIVGIASVVLWRNVSLAIAPEQSDTCIQEEEIIRSPGLNREQKAVLVSVVADEKNRTGVIHVWADTIVSEDIKSIDSIIAVEVSSYRLPVSVYVDARYNVHKVAAELEELLLAYDVDAAMLEDRENSR